ncbi:unnamed protein product, partial [Rotaria sordida]
IPSMQQLNNNRQRVMLIEKAYGLISNSYSCLTSNKEFDQTILYNNHIHALIDVLRILMVE